MPKKFQIVREYSVFPYFIDFAFPQIMLAVEIDGSQHEIKDRKKRDMEKDIHLNNNGWRVYRIPAKHMYSKEDADKPYNI